MTFAPPGGPPAYAEPVAPSWGPPPVIADGGAVSTTPPPPPRQNLSARARGLRGALLAALTVVSLLGSYWTAGLIHPSANVSAISVPAGAGSNTLPGGVPAANAGAVPAVQALPAPNASGPFSLQFTGDVVAGVTRPDANTMCTSGEVQLRLPIGERTWDAHVHKTDFSSTAPQPVGRFMGRPTAEFDAAPFVPKGLEEVLYESAEDPSPSGLIRFDAGAHSGDLDIVFLRTPGTGWVEVKGHFRC